MRASRHLRRVIVSGGVKPEVAQFREVCQRCRRPARVCYCAHLQALETRTRVVIVQHPRERDMAIGTAHMASLCLPNSELHVGVHFEAQSALGRALTAPNQPAILLYPGEGAIDITRSPPKGPVTLVVVDGTWSQAKKVVRENPLLSSLPRYAFQPPAPSEYRIRREPQENYVSTIEALMHVLGALEGGAERFSALLAPFRAMVDAQIAHATEFRCVRHARPRAKTPKAPAIPAILRERAADIVCVYGEANAWPYTSPMRPAHPEEILHWVAHRPATGETFDRRIKLTSPLAGATLAHAELGARDLDDARDFDAVVADWRDFLRPRDVVCSWGTYATKLFSAAGGPLGDTRLDLRTVARVWSNGKVGTLEDCVALEGDAAPAPLTAGRAGRRLAQMALIAARFASRA